MPTVSKTKALEMYRSARNRVKNIAEKAAAQSDAITGLGVSVVAAAGMGYYMAKSTDTDGQWWGLDKEIWITAITAVLGFYLGGRSDKSSQMTSKLMLSVATGVGSAYAYNVAFEKGQSA